MGASAVCGAAGVRLAKSPVLASGTGSSPSVSQNSSRVE